MATAKQLAARARFAAAARAGTLRKGSRLGASRSSPRTGGKDKLTTGKRRKRGSTRSGSTLRFAKAVAAPAIAGALAPAVSLIPVVGDYAPSAVMTVAGVIGGNETMRDVGAFGLVAKASAAAIDFVASTTGSGLRSGPANYI